MDNQPRPMDPNRRANAALNLLQAIAVSQDESFFATMDKKQAATRFSDALMSKAIDLVIFNEDLSKRCDEVEKLLKHQMDNVDRLSIVAAYVMCDWLDKNVYHGNSGAFPTSEAFRDAFFKDRNQES